MDKFQHIQQQIESLRALEQQLQQDEVVARQGRYARQELQFQYEQTKRELELSSEEVQHCHSIIQQLRDRVQVLQESNSALMQKLNARVALEPLQDLQKIIPQKSEQITQLQQESPAEQKIHISIQTDEVSKTCVAIQTDDFALTKCDHNYFQSTEDTQSILFSPVSILKQVVQQNQQLQKKLQQQPQNTLQKQIQEKGKYLGQKSSQTTAEIKSSQEIQGKKSIFSQKNSKQTQSQQHSKKRFVSGISQLNICDDQPGKAKRSLRFQVKRKRQKTDEHSFSAGQKNCKVDQQLSDKQSKQNNLGLQQQQHRNQSNEKLQMCSKSLESQENIDDNNIKQRLINSEELFQGRNKFSNFSYCSQGNAQNQQNNHQFFIRSQQEKVSKMQMDNEFLRFDNSNDVNQQSNPNNELDYKQFQNLNNTHQSNLQSLQNQQTNSQFCKSDSSIQQQQQNLCRDGNRQNIQRIDHQVSYSNNSFAHNGLQLQKGEATMQSDGNGKSNMMQNDENLEEEALFQYSSDPAQLFTGSVGEDQQQISGTNILSILQGGQSNSFQNDDGQNSDPTELAPRGSENVSARMTKVASVVKSLRFGTDDMQIDNQQVIDEWLLDIPQLQKRQDVRQECQLDTTEVVEKQDDIHLKKPKEFKYEEVVRKKSEREKLNGHTCHACDQFYEALISWGKIVERPECGHVGDKLNKKELLQMGSRHRSKHQVAATPPGFWHNGFNDTAEQEYLHKVRAQIQNPNQQPNSQSFFNN